MIYRGWGSQGRQIQGMKQGSHYLLYMSEHINLNNIKKV